MNRRKLVRNHCLCWSNMSGNTYQPNAFNYNDKAYIRGEQSDRDRPDMESFRKSRELTKSSRVRVH